MIRLYFVDDQPLVLEGLRSLLRSESDIELVGQTRNGHSCLSFLLDHSTDVILMDSILPDISGSDLCATIKARYPGIMVLGLSSFKERKYVSSMMDSGASGYLLNPRYPRTKRTMTIAPTHQMMLFMHAPTSATGSIGGMLPRDRLRVQRVYGPEGSDRSRVRLLRGEIRRTAR